MEKNVLNTDLTGKMAVVTGASGTLCSIFAKALARAGAKVALLGRNMDKLKELADKIEAEGGIAKGYTCNVMNKANCLQVAEDVMVDSSSESSWSCPCSYEFRATEFITSYYGTSCISLREQNQLNQPIKASESLSY